MAYYFKCHAIKIAAATRTSASTGSGLDAPQSAIADDARRGYFTSCKPIRAAASPTITPADYDASAGQPAGDFDTLTARATPCPRQLAESRDR